MQYHRRYFIPMTAPCDRCGVHAECPESFPEITIGDHSLEPAFLCQDCMTTYRQTLGKDSKRRREATQSFYGLGWRGLSS